MTISPDGPTRSLTQAFGGARVLLTGGAGFIAGHLAEALVKNGAEVTLVDRRTRPHPGSLRRACRHIHALSVGSPSFGKLLAADGPYDYIFHLAARAYAAGSVVQPYADFTTNLVATVRLLEQLRALGSKTSSLVFASSAAVYGNPAKLPVEETDPTVPVSPYGVSKLAAERYVAVYARLYGLPAASLRLFSVYGPGQTKQVVYDLLVKLRASPNHLVVLGDGTQVRDLMYVGDVAQAFMVAAANGRTDGAVYNVASGVGTSTADLAREIVAVQEADAAISFTGATRPGDPERWVGSWAALGSLGWAPRHSLRDGLDATTHWFNTLRGSSFEKPVEPR